MCSGLACPVYLLPGSRLFIAVNGPTASAISNRQVYRAQHISLITTNRPTLHVRCFIWFWSWCACEYVCAYGYVCACACACESSFWSLQCLPANSLRRYLAPTHRLDRLGIDHRLGHHQNQFARREKSIEAGSRTDRYLLR